jgi:hypothetical protein
VPPVWAGHRLDMAAERHPHASEPGLPTPIPPDPGEPAPPLPEPIPGPQPEPEPEPEPERAAVLLRLAELPRAARERRRRSATMAGGLVRMGGSSTVRSLESSK